MVEALAMIIAWVNGRFIKRDKQIYVRTYSVKDMRSLTVVI